MSLATEDMVMVLQRFVDNFPNDLLAVRTALADGATPPEAARFLIGGVNYAMDALDMFPDHHKGIGIADDAIVLRLSAKLARAAGATHPAIESLALDANNVLALFEDLAGPLERLVAQFPEREVRGRTAATVLASKDAMVMFDADLGREAKRHKPAPIGNGPAGERAVIELRKMMVHALQRAGIS